MAAIMSSTRARCRSTTPLGSWTDQSAERTASNPGVYGYGWCRRRWLVLLTGWTVMFMLLCAEVYLWPMDAYVPRGLGRERREVSLSQLCQHCPMEMAMAGRR